MLRMWMYRVLPSMFYCGCLLISLPVSGDEVSSDNNSVRPLYWACVDDLCGPATEPGRDGDGNLLLGYIKESAEPGTVPLHWGCVALIHLGGCRYHALVAHPRYDNSPLLGYILAEPRPGTVALYWNCKQRDIFGECTELAPDNRGGAAGDSRLLGYVYADLRSQAD